MRVGVDGFWPQADAIEQGGDALPTFFRRAEIVDDQRFADSIIAIARNPQQGFGAWSDGETLLGFFSLRDDRGYRRPFIYEAELLELIEKALTDTIRWSSSDMLSTLVDAVDAADGLGLPPQYSPCLAGGCA